MQGCNDAQGGEDRDIEPVYLLQSRVTVESVIDAWDGGSPHQNNDSEIVELISKLLYMRTMVTNDMISALRSAESPRSRGV